MSETLRFDGDLSSVSRFVMLRRTGRRFYAKLGGQSSQVGPATARVLAGFRCEGTGPSTHQVRDNPTQVNRHISQSISDS